MDFSAIIEGLQHSPACFKASCWVYQFIGKIKVAIILSS